MTRKAKDFSELSSGAMRCRSFGHSWNPYTAKFDSRAKGWNVTLVCGNDCGTMKHFQLSQRGDYGSPHYSYSDNYLATFYIGADERNSMRLEALTGFVTKPLRVVKGGKAG